MAANKSILETEDYYDSLNYRYASALSENRRLKLKIMELESQFNAFNPIMDAEILLECYRHLEQRKIWSANHANEAWLKGEYLQ